MISESVMRRKSIDGRDPIPLLVASPPCRTSSSLERIWPDRAGDTPGRADRPGGALPDRTDVVAMMVSSLDGRAAVAGSSRPLGGPVDLQLLVALRRRADALLVGPGTVRARATAALAVPGRARLALVRRAVGGGAVPAPGQRVLVYTHARREPPAGRGGGRGRAARRARARCSPTCAGAASSPLLCEGGPTLNRALLAAGLLDELFLTLSPVVTGDESQPAIVMGGALPAPARLALRSVATADGELYLRYSV